MIKSFYTKQITIGPFLKLSTTQKILSFQLPSPQHACPRCSDAEQDQLESLESPNYIVCFLIYFRMPCSVHGTIPDSIPSKLLPQIFLANVLFVGTLYAGKEWLLDFDVGVFWLVMRVLACGGLGVLVWERMTGQLAKRRTIEERFTTTTMVTH
jgi:hypothetical protein